MICHLFKEGIIVILMLNINKLELLKSKEEIYLYIGLKK